MTKKAVSIRLGVPVVVLAAVFAGLASCSSSPNSPSGVAAAPSPSPEIVTVLVKVSNTHFGNAIPSDFKLSVSYDGAAASTSTVTGSDQKVDLPVPSGANYQVSVAPVEGYTFTMSPGCSGTSTSAAATCEVTASDIEITCDKSLWDPVYTKDRLKILSPCEVGTGTVHGIEIERDGDLEVWITPDPQYNKWMRPGNKYVRNGWFILEVPCQAPIVQDDAKGTCDKFTGTKARVPEVGEHVAVSGPWVEDRTHNMWGELHGARIVKLNR